MDMQPENTAPNQTPTITVLMDGKPVQVPESSLDSFSALRAQLEVIALRQNRVLADVCLDGVAIQADQAKLPLDGTHQVQAQTISFQELGLQMTQTALRQSDHLEIRAEQALTRVLINESAQAWELMRSLDAEIRPLLVLTSFMQELRGARLIELGVDPARFAQHLEKMQKIRAAWNHLESRQDVIALSDLIEQQLLPWVVQLGVYLRQIHEK